MRNVIKKLGRRMAGTWGRVHGPTKGGSKRVASKGCRKAGKMELREQSGPVDSGHYGRSVIGQNITGWGSNIAD